MVEAFGVREAAGRLRRIGQRAANPRLFASRAREILLAEDLERWKRHPWRPLDADTKRRKAHEGKDPRILRVSGVLYRALTEAGAPGQRYDVEGDELIFGLDPQGVAYYGKFHQGGKSVPKREVLKVTPRLVKSMRRAWGAWIVGRE